MLGEAQFELNNFAGARTSFLKALEKDPGDYSIWFDLGTATTGRAQIRAYTRARQLNPLDVNFAFLNVYNLNIPQPRVSP